MTAAIEAGLPKMRIEEAAARTQARIDSGRQPVIGVNMFRPDTPDSIDVLKVDNTSVRNQQLAKLERLRAERDEDACQAALQRLTDAAAASVDGHPRSRPRTELPEARRRRRSRTGHRGRDQRRVGEGVRSPHRHDPYDPGCVPQRDRRRSERRACP